MRKRILALILALAMCFGLAGTALAEGERKTVYASTVEELLAILKAPGQKENLTIMLEDKEYKLEEGISVWGRNLTIQGTGNTKITVSSERDLVISVVGSENVTLKGLILGHDVPPTITCGMGVVYVSSSSANIENCDIFGCGLEGIETQLSDIYVNNTIIRDCSSNIAYIFNNSTGTFTDCAFYGNEGGVAVPVSNDSQATYTNCKFVDNNNSTLMRNDSGPCLFNDCIFYGNAWGGDNTTTRPDISMDLTATPSNPAAPISPTTTTIPAAPTASTVLVNGEKKSFDAYNIEGNNYFKLRDLAYVLNGTDKQFEVGWDAAANAISLTSGKAYTAAGGEMAAQESPAQAEAVRSSSKILLDGAEVALTAYTINGNNYFKLRDLGQAFDFGVGWDGEAQTISIDTSTGYTAE